MLRCYRKDFDVYLEDRDEHGVVDGEVKWTNIQYTDYGDDDGLAVVDEYIKVFNDLCFTIQKEVYALSISYKFPECIKEWVAEVNRRALAKEYISVS